MPSLFFKSRKPDEQNLNDFDFACSFIKHYKAIAKFFFQIPKTRRAKLQ